LPLTPQSLAGGTLSIAAHISIIGRGYTFHCGPFFNYWPAAYFPLPLTFQLLAGGILSIAAHTLSPGRGILSIAAHISVPGRGVLSMAAHISIIGRGYAFHWGPLFNYWPAAYFPLPLTLQVLARVYFPLPLTFQFPAGGMLSIAAHTSTVGRGHIFLCRPHFNYWPGVYFPLPLTFQFLAGGMLSIAAHI
jgi:hypothetical protein